MGLGLRVHPAACVAHYQHHVGAGLDADVQAGIALVQVYVRRLDGEPAALGHGVARVDGEVDEHLFDLPGVSFRRPEIDAEGSDEVDVLPDGAPEHPLHLDNDVVEVQHPWFNHLPATERQELAGQRGRAFGGLLHFLDVHA